MADKADKVETPVELTAEEIKAREAAVAADVAKRNATTAPEPQPEPEPQPQPEPPPAGKDKGFSSSRDR